jgi:hypothetical protein
VRLSRPLCYRRIAARRGKLKAVVAIERAILTAVFHMLSTGTYYQTQDRSTTAGTTPANAQPVPYAPSEPSATRSPFTP